MNALFPEVQNKHITLGDVELIGGSDGDVSVSDTLSIHAGDAVDMRSDVLNVGVGGSASGVVGDVASLRAGSTIVESSGTIDVSSGMGGIPRQTEQLPARRPTYPAVRSRQLATVCLAFVEPDALPFSAALRWRGNRGA